MWDRNHFEIGKNTILVSISRVTFLPVH
jgi:hypothetical protein